MSKTYEDLLKMGKEALDLVKIPFEVRKAEKDLEKEIINSERNAPIVMANAIAAKQKEFDEDKAGVESGLKEEIERRREENDQLLDIKTKNKKLIKQADGGFRTKYCIESADPNYAVFEMCFLEEDLESGASYRAGLLNDMALGGQ